MDEVKGIGKIRMLSKITGKLKREKNKKDSNNRPDHDKSGIEPDDENDSSTSKERKPHGKWYRKNPEILMRLIKTPLRKIKKSLFIDKKV